MNERKKNKHVQKLIVKVTIEQIYLLFFFREAFSSYAASIGFRHWGPGDQGTTKALLLLHQP